MFVALSRILKIVDTVIIIQEHLLLQQGTHLKGNPLRNLKAIAGNEMFGMTQKKNIISYDGDTKIPLQHVLVWPNTVTAWVCRWGSGNDQGSNKRILTEEQCIFLKDGMVVMFWVCSIHMRCDYIALLMRRHISLRFDVTSV